MTKTERDYGAMLRQHGVTILERRQKRHLVLRCEAACGKRFTLTLAVSPSDHRARHNIEKTLRKIISN